jgi:hypothetical protein
VVSPDDKPPEPDPTVLWILVITAGLWGLLYLVVVNLWSSSSGRPDTVIERKHVPQIASLVDRPRIMSRPRAKMKVKRKRQRMALAVRIFRLSASIN